ADVVRLFGESYKEQHRLPDSHRRVLENIVNCRTAALGGHMEECDLCDHRQAAYNSCGDRHCTKCGVMAKEAWLAARRAELLPVPYFHQVFTFPHELNQLTLANKRVVLGLLFKAVSDTLLEFGKGKGDRGGGKAGFTLVLHTWDQQLRDHFHLHCVIPAGALSKDGTSWIPARSASYLFDVKSLGLVFREKFLTLLEAAHGEKRLIFPGQLEPLAAPHIFAEDLVRLRAKTWVVYSKAPFHGGPEQVLDYLGRYTHRIAISNHRILDVSEAGVTFSYRDRKDGNALKTMTVSGHEFLRRFLLHVLPRRFQRIRHYGFLAARAKGEELAKCRAALGATEAPVEPEKMTAVERLLKVSGIDVLKCPCCEAGRMKRSDFLAPTRAARRVPSLIDVLNTS
ncbi:MAG: IS91 family transposase, partial [Cyanobacteria bacterium REEB65]|nr:IS91 family transposase [Cyanobacteria bacterium REEB65]